MPTKFVSKYLDYCEKKGEIVTFEGLKEYYRINKKGAAEAANLK